MLPGHHQFKAMLAQSSAAARAPRRRKPTPTLALQSVGTSHAGSSGSPAPSSSPGGRSGGGGSGVPETDGGDADAPLARMKRDLANERARRRRHFAATQQPVIFDAFAERAGSPGKASVDTACIPGVEANRAWLEEAEDASAASPEDAEASAVGKIRRAAIFFDRSYASSRESFRAFEAPRLSYSQLAEMVRNASNVRLTRREARALAARFDPDGRGEVDGPDFVRFFFRCGFEGRTEERTRRQERADDAERSARRAAARVSEADEAEKNRPVTAAWTREDEVGAWTKLGKVAKNKGLQGDVISRAAFESLMTPAEIRLQLIKSYNLFMSPAEMGAVCSRFDKNASGQINGAEFQYEWSHVLDHNRSRTFFAKIREGARRTSLLAAPQLDALDARPDTTNAIADGDVRKANVMRLSFGRACFGRASSARASLRPPGQPAFFQDAVAVPESPIAARRARPKTASDAVPFARRRPSSLAIPSVVAPRPLTRERSILKTAPAALRLRPVAIKKPRLPEAARTPSPKRKKSPKKESAFGGDIDSPAASPTLRRAEDYDGDFAMMMLSSHPTNAWARNAARPAAKDPRPSSSASRAGSRPGTSGATALK